MSNENAYRVSLMANRNVVRKFDINASSEKDAKEWGKLMIKKKGYDDTLIQVKVTKTE